MVENLGDRVAKSTLGDVLPNIVFYGVGLLLLLFLGDMWPLIGKIGFWVYALFAAVDVVRVVILWGTGIALLFGRERIMKPVRWAAIIGHTIELGAIAFYTHVLFVGFISAPS